MNVTKRQIDSDVGQSCLEIEGHPDLDEIWIRILTETRGSITFRCSTQTAVQLAYRISETVGDVFGQRTYGPNWLIQGQSLSSHPIPMSTRERGDDG